MDFLQNSAFSIFNIFYFKDFFDIMCGKSMYYAPSTINDLLRTGCILTKKTRFHAQPASLTLGPLMQTHV